MKIAIVHDFLTQAGGAERVVGVLHRMFPEAPILTTLVNRDTLWADLRAADIRSTWMEHLPGAHRFFRAYLPAFPFAVASLDLREYDLVISSSCAFAKGVATRPDATHVCYCHTPMRALWDTAQYAQRSTGNSLAVGALRPLLSMLRRWDTYTASRPTRFVANSRYIAERIRALYGRDADLVPPPVDTSRFAPATTVDDYHLVVSRLVPYKRIDLAIRAFNRMGRRLVVVGDGPARAALERLAGPTIELLGHRPDHEVVQLYARSQGLVFPGAEDFGITPLEANASGRPVIAYAAGGALETVVDGETGVLFPEQTVESLEAAVRRADATDWSTARLRAQAAAFGEERFRERLMSTIDRVLAERGRAAVRPAPLLTMPAAPRRSRPEGLVPLVADEVAAP